MANLGPLPSWSSRDSASNLDHGFGCRGSPSASNSKATATARKEKKKTRAFSRCSRVNRDVNINGLLSLCVCCSGSAGESAGRRGSRLGDLAIPAQVTRGPRPRPARRNRRGQLRRTGPSHASGGGERRARCGTPARHRRRRRQTAVGGMDTSERAV